MTRTLDLDTLTLADGAHPDHEAMCVMEAVAFIAGEDWSDDVDEDEGPDCLGRAVSTPRATSRRAPWLTTTSLGTAA